ncbi:MAG: GyrI-like domain-containing protein [Deltaproteobacteria bacterium]|nr:GyrI-like domain-containing protein [Deltaproteobacteria bacterium]MBW2087113.1 GyrI-like domain-containing protein [Deltaproteobacteria bacterium]
MLEKITGTSDLSRRKERPGELREAHDAFFEKWLPESGYQPEDQPCYELYYGDPKDNPENKFIFDICLPVKPL